MGRMEKEIESFGVAGRHGSRMGVAVIDNGSVSPAAQEHVRGVAKTISELAGVEVESVSWKHSPVTVGPWMRSRYADGVRDFLFVPYFISPQGAIGSALDAELRALARELPGVSHRFSGSLAAAGVLPRIIAENAREAMRARGLHRPRLIVVDHGGPSAASTRLRDEVAAAAAALLQDLVSEILPASMESSPPVLGDLLADNLAEPANLAGNSNYLIAPLFLLPGRHAGQAGDLARIAGAHPNVYFAESIGAHPLAAQTLAAELARELADKPEPATPSLS
jgi:hypothetical protein